MFAVKFNTWVIFTHLEVVGDLSAFENQNLK